MSEIKEIKGIWTAEQVKEIKKWVSSSEGSNKIVNSQNKAKELSGEINKISQVDAVKVKEPFTFNY